MKGALIILGFGLAVWLACSYLAHRYEEAHPSAASRERAPAGR